ncbi:MAG: ATP synthase F1 subunit gamma [Abditibacteriota bacterium]|nr:ATP synthase F1 subunit gamma [Abditibacteriota bacterium]
MANTKDIKKRIKSTRSIEKITAAMKVTSTTKLKRYQLAAEQARPYADAIMDMVRTLSAGASQINSPLFEVREKARVLYVVLGADGGLCGSYNTNVLKKAEEAISRNSSSETHVLPCGKKCVAYFAKKPYACEKRAEDLGRLTYAQVEDITGYAIDMFRNGLIDAVYLVYSRFVSAMSQKPTVKKLLPMTPMHEGIIDSSRLTMDMIFEPAMDEILGDLLPKYLNTVVYQAVNEAIASEHGARMTAMTSANTNAQDLLQELSLQYNKARQAIITNELIDIVNGVSGIK